MEEFFDLDYLVKYKIWGFSKKIRYDYKTICDFFGFKTIYEYGAEEVRCHLSYDGERPKDEPFVTVIESIY